MVFVNSTWKYLAPRFPCEPWAVPYSHRLLPVCHKRCHRLWPLVHKHFLSKLLCHKRRKAVPWVKWKKDKFLKASRSWASCPPLSLSLWVIWAQDPPSQDLRGHLIHKSLNHSYPLSLINTISCPWLRGRTIEVLLCCWIDHLAQAIWEHTEKIWSLWGWSVGFMEMHVDTKA